MKNIILLLFIASFFLISCNDSPTNTIKDDKSNNSAETTEDKALNAVTSLPEYHEANIQIKAMTNGEQSLTCIIDEPNKNHSEYYIEVGYNKETWFEPYYHFLVNPETFDVFIEDAVEGDVVSIDVWRKRESQR